MSKDNSLMVLDNGLHGSPKDIQEALKSITDRKGLEEVKLSKIHAKISERQKVVEAGAACRSKIQDNFNEMAKSYLNVCNSVQGQAINAGITVNADLTINYDKFENFIECFDRRKGLDALLDGVMVNDEFVIDDFETTGNAFYEVATKIGNSNTSALKKNFSEKIAFQRLFDDNFEIRYSVTYKNDDIFHMSPGKRGLVLLTLMLELSNATHPILIDQPEDNLDNRTIYSELKDFIKSCKSKRQIIIVTHNANLVVSADADCVIVAEQKGIEEDIIETNYRFNYFSGSLELSYGSEHSEVYSELSDLGIRQHVCHILEGGVKAFKEREKKYNLSV